MMEKTIINGAALYDTDGSVLHAHGGHIIRYGDYWYWYGENRRENIYVSCYRSADLVNWEHRANSLTTASKAAPIRQRTELTLTRGDGGKVNLERPKVLYNEITRKFVMWAHYENGVDYKDAACAVASCDTPDGEFTYHGSFRPFGNMSRDCTLFADDDGRAYFISASRDNADLCFYLLQDDYLNVSKLVNTAFSNEYREAPALVKRNGSYYLLTSRCTGWRPNQGGWSAADSIEGEWSRIENLGDELTFRTQPAFILTYGDKCCYVGDRWGGIGWNLKDGFDYSASSYYFTELKFDEKGAAFIEPAELYIPGAQS